MIDLINSKCEKSSLVKSVYHYQFCNCKFSLKSAVGKAVDLNYGFDSAPFEHLLKVELVFTLSLRVGKCIKYLSSTDADKYALNVQGM